MQTQHNVSMATTQSARSAALRTKYILLSIIFGVLIVGLAVTMYVTKQSQDTRAPAYYPAGQAPQNPYQPPPNNANGGSGNTDANSPTNRYQR